MIHKVYICFLKAETILLFMFCNSPLWIWQIEKKKKKNNLLKSNICQEGSCWKDGRYSTPNIGNEGEDFSVFCIQLWGSSLKVLPKTWETAVIIPFHENPVLF